MNRLHVLAAAGLVALAGCIDQPTAPVASPGSITPGFLNGTKSTNQCRRTSSTGARWASRFNLAGLSTGVTGIALIRPSPPP